MGLVSQPKRDRLGHPTSSPSIYSCSLWCGSGVPTTYCINIILTSSDFFQYLILREQNKSYKINSTNFKYNIEIIKYIKSKTSKTLIIYSFIYSFASFLYLSQQLDILHLAVLVCCWFLISI